MRWRGAIMSPALTPYFYCLAGFLCGAIPFGFLAGRLQGIDLREHGSGNIGATNTIRILGKAVGIPVLLLDTAKGFLPVFLAQNRGISSWWVVGVGLCAVIGHIYSPVVRFRGGKGVATSLGVLVGLSPLVAALSLGVFLLGLILSRGIISVGSIAGAMAAPMVFWLLPEQSLPVRLFATIAGLFILWRHRENLSRLARGEEKSLWRDR